MKSPEGIGRVTPAWEHGVEQSAKGLGVLLASEWVQLQWSLSAYPSAAAGGSGAWGTQQERHSSCPRGPRLLLRSSQVEGPAEEVCLCQPQPGNSRKDTGHFTVTVEPVGTDGDKNQSQVTAISIASG